MAISKVVYAGRTLVDLTDSPATAADVAAGKVFYLASGTKAAGAGVGGTAITEYSQQNSQVTDYLAASSTYTDANRQTTSVIGDYASTSDSTDKDRPDGVTLSLTSAGTLYLTDETTGNGWTETVSASGSHTVYNLVPGHIWRWALVDGNGAVVQGGRVKPTGQVRMLYLSGVKNARDLGGWKCDGGTVRYGRMFRTATPVSATTADKALMVTSWGLGEHVDLRGTDELGDTSSKWGSTVHFDNVDGGYRAECFSNKKAETIAAMRAVMDAVSRGGVAAFNCTQGMDRTGMVGWLLLALLGVDSCDCDRDWELSALCYGATTGSAGVRKRTEHAYYAANGLSSYGGSTYAAKCAAYLYSGGVSLDLVNSFRRAAIDGTPSTITPAGIGVTYSVTVSATNATVTPSATKVTWGDPLTATVTVGDGYTLSSVVVTMGGVNVTSSYYGDGKLSITSVTGDVVITATAEATAPAYTNYARKSVTSDGTALSLPKAGCYVSGSGTQGDFSADSACCATGRIDIPLGTKQVWVRCPGIFSGNSHERYYISDVWSDTPTTTALYQQKTIPSAWKGLTFTKLDSETFRIEAADNTTAHQWSICISWYGTDPSALIVTCDDDITKYD